MTKQSTIDKAGGGLGAVRQLKLGIKPSRVPASDPKCPTGFRRCRLRRERSKPRARRQGCGSSGGAPLEHLTTRVVSRQRLIHRGSWLHTVLLSISSHASGDPT